MKILLVEDETRLSEALQYILQKNGYTVDNAFDGETGEYMALHGNFDLIILDRLLPSKEGSYILRDIRKQGIVTPVIFLTALDSVTHKVEGLDAGADDYLVKPFSTEELLARIRALSRRPRQLSEGGRLTFGDLSLELLRNELSQNDKTLKLTVKEAQLLEFFIRNKRQVLSKEKILERVWGLDSEVELNNIEIYIHFLRKKFDTLQTTVTIQTIRGMGYCLQEA